MPTKAEKRPRVYLNSVHLKGFKSIEDLTIDLKKGLNILIGKNGAGKSNFMEFIDLVIRRRGQFKGVYKYAQIEIISDDSHSFVIRIERKAHFNLKEKKLSNRLGFTETVAIDGKVVFENSDDELKRKIEFKNRKITYYSNPTLLFTSLGYRPVVTKYIQFNLPTNIECIDSPGILKFTFEDEFADWSDNTPSFIDQIFWNIASFYTANSDKLRNLNSVDFHQQLTLPFDIIDNLKRFTTIEDLRFNSNINIYFDDKSTIIENIKLEFKVNNNWLPWSQLSDGTKRLFYIISEITSTKGQVLIEEPELGIHPHQFNLLMDFLKEQSEDKQIIISTHSPKALDHLSPTELDHILIAYYDLEKGTQIRHLSEKELKKAQKYMKEVGFFSDYWMLSDLE